jgi:hypothetical protein
MLFHGHPKTRDERRKHVPTPVSDKLRCDRRLRRKIMKAKKAMRDEHGPRHVTPAGRSVFYDLFPKAEADELVMRSTLLRGLEQWLKESGLTQTQAKAEIGGVRKSVDVRWLDANACCRAGLCGLRIGCRCISHRYAARAWAQAQNGPHKKIMGAGITLLCQLTLNYAECKSVRRSTHCRHRIL